MHRAKSICRKVGCNLLLNSPGYCETHKPDTKERFKNLKKAPGSQEFYNSIGWKKTRRSFRASNPLCEGHKKMGIIKKGDLVDHVVERLDIIAMGENPLDWKYLQTLCYACHNKKLAQRNKKH